MAIINLFPSHVPVGTVSIPDAEGRMRTYQVASSAELVRTFSGVLDRIGGVDGLSVADLEILASYVAGPDATIQQAIDDLRADLNPESLIAQVALLRQEVADARAERATDPGAEIAVLKAAVADLQAQLAFTAQLEARVAAMQGRLEDLGVLATYQDQFRVDWGRPGSLGRETANAASVTTFTASGAVALSPANANVVLSPTGTGVVTINPATAGTMNNIAVGGSTPLAGAFTTVSATGQLTSTVATGTSPFAVSSTTNVANLNASSLNGATFAAPGAIGGGTAAAGTFTTLTATSTTTLSTTNISNLLSVAKNGNSTQICAAIRNNDGTAAGAGQTRMDWGNDAGTNKFTIGLNASTHATRPGYAEIIQQTNSPLVIAQNGNDSITINSTGTGFFGVAPVARQVSGATVAGVIVGLVNLGLFSS